MGNREKRRAGESVKLLLRVGRSFAEVQGEPVFVLVSCKFFRCQAKAAFVSRKLKIPVVRYRLSSPGLNGKASFECFFHAAFFRSASDVYDCEKTDAEKVSRKECESLHKVGEGER